MSKEETWKKVRELISSLEEQKEVNYFAIIFDSDEAILNSSCNYEDLAGSLTQAAEQDEFLAEVLIRVAARIISKSDEMHIHFPEKVEEGNEDNKTVEASKEES